MLNVLISVLLLVCVDAGAKTKKSNAKNAPTPALSDEQFEFEARHLAGDLKQGLIQNLSKELTTNGAASAISFCHLNAKSILQKAAKDRASKFEFGRTSHKIRNSENAPAEWALPWLEKFKGQTKEQIAKDYFVEKINGKRVYFEPLYVQGLCLSCHGEKIAPDVQSKITSLYPNDQAVGFKLGEFRGLLWIR